MNTVQYGEWKIAVDREKTKEYYQNYARTDLQANRNFAEYCKNLSEEERAFFNAFGITPECCEIQHIGVSKKKEFPCGGYYFVCGRYLEYPPENVITVEELAENDFVDDRPDPRVDVGIFQFDFQCEEYEFHDIPEQMPEGFLCIRFWCEDMKWLLRETPEERMYEPPRFWEIHKIIREKILQKKQRKLDLEEARQGFEAVFQELGMEYCAMNDRELDDYKRQWVLSLTPQDADKKSRKEIQKLCLDHRRYTSFLWHIFSFDWLHAKTEREATEAFDQVKKDSCIIVSNVEKLGYKLKNADRLTAARSEEFMDVTISAEDLSWTYSKTHEEMCGPYFYKK